MHHDPAPSAPHEDGSTHQAEAPVDTSSPRTTCGLAAVSNDCTPVDVAFLCSDQAFPRCPSQVAAAVALALALPVVEKTVAAVELASLPNHPSTSSPTADSARAPLYEMVDKA